MCMDQGIRARWLGSFQGALEVSVSRLCSGEARARHRPSRGLCRLGGGSTHTVQRGCLAELTLQREKASSRADGQGGPHASAGCTGRPEM